MPPKYISANYTMLDLYFTNLHLEPNRTYCCSFDSLGGELELNVSQRALEHGSLVRIPPSSVWQKHTFTFRLGNSPHALKQFVNFGISFNKTLWPEHAYGAVIADSYIDNFQIYKSDDPNHRLVSGGDFEVDISNAIYQQNWRKILFSRNAKSFGVTRVTDPLNPKNHCLKIPSVINRPTYADSIGLRAVSFGHIDNNQHPVENVVLEPHPQHHLLLVESGVVTVADTTVEKGHLLYFPPQSRYHYSCSPKVNGCYYWLTVAGSDADLLFKECGLTDVCIKPISNFRSLTQQIDEMLRVREYGLVQQYELNAHLQLFFSHLHRQLSSFDISKHHRELLKEIIDRISRYPERPISNTRLAQKCNLSEHYFITLFKQYTKDTPQEYRIKVLMCKACNQLEKTDLSIQEIAYLLGFSDPAYFSRLFRKTQGVSPRQYRQNLN